MWEQTHYLPTSLPWGDGSRAHWAIRPNGDVFVFVHGFNGSAVKTWCAFDALLPLQGHHDIVYFGYDSIRLSARVASIDLRDFLIDLCTKPSIVVNSTLEKDLHRDSTFQVSRVFVVAHSLGAVISRCALLDIRNLRSAWAARITLALFAPAHMGAHLLSLLTSVMSPLKLPLAPIAQWTFPVLDELKPGSPFLKDLRDQTRVALQSGDADFLRARLVAIAREDRVVKSDTFCEHDANAVALARGHVDICKPSDAYTAPVDLLMELLSS